MMGEGYLSYADPEKAILVVPNSQSYQRQTEHNRARVAAEEKMGALQAHRRGQIA